MKRMINPVTFPTLDFARAAGRYRKRPPVPPDDQWVTWEDDMPRTGISKDGVNLVMYLPGVHSPADVVSDCRQNVKIYMTNCCR